MSNATNTTIFIKKKFTTAELVNSQYALTTNTILLSTINNLSPQTLMRFVINYVVNLVLFFFHFSCPAYI